MQSDQFVTHYSCPECDQTFTRSIELLPVSKDGVFEFLIPDEDETGQCPHCGSTINLDEAQLLVPLFFLAPVIRCFRCQTAMQLPFSPVPQTDSAGKVVLGGIDPPTLPPALWTATFACRSCGALKSYGHESVTIAPVQSWSKHTHHHQSGKGLYRATFSCGNGNCAIRAEVHVDIREESPSAAAIVELLRTGLRGGQRLPCGHEMKTMPAKYYEVEPVLRCMW